jgi:hypothetical protein
MTWRALFATRPCNLGDDVLLVLDDFTGLVGFSTQMMQLSPQVDQFNEEASMDKMVEYEGRNFQLFHLSVDT